jgi:hypothetical protein
MPHRWGKHPRRFEGGVDYFARCYNILENPLSAVTLDEMRVRARVCARVCACVRVCARASRVCARGFIVYLF